MPAIGDRVREVQRVATRAPAGDRHGRPGQLVRVDVADADACVDRHLTGLVLGERRRRAGSGAQRRDVVDAADRDNHGRGRRLRSARVLGDVGERVGRRLVRGEVVERPRGVVGHRATGPDANRPDGRGAVDGGNRKCVAVGVGVVREHGDGDRRVLIGARAVALRHRRSVGGPSRAARTARRRYGHGRLPRDERQELLEPAALAAARALRHAHRLRAPLDAEELVRRAWQRQPLLVRRARSPAGGELVGDPSRRYDAARLDRPAPADADLGRSRVELHELADARPALTRTRDEAQAAGRLERARQLDGLRLWGRSRRRDFAAGRRGNRARDNREAG